VAGGVVVVVGLEVVVGDGVVGAVVVVVVAVGLAVVVGAVVVVVGGVVVEPPWLQDTSTSDSTSNTLTATQIIVRFILHFLLNYFCQNKFRLRIQCVAEMIIFISPTSLTDSGNKPRLIYLSFYLDDIIFSGFIFQVKQPVKLERKVTRLNALIFLQRTFIQFGNLFKNQIEKVRSKYTICDSKCQIIVLIILIRSEYRTILRNKRLFVREYWSATNSRRPFVTDFLPYLNLIRNNWQK
jgi:hypothetical protein